MLDFIKEKKNCCGCQACMEACPVSCISMIKDSEGFLYPVSSENCIHCQSCELVCPIQNKPLTYTCEKKVVAGKTNDYRVWKNSSSGGAFYELCALWGNDETYYYGAAWDGFTVKHMGVKGISNILPLQRSKYMYSDTNGTFMDVFKRLSDGKYVVFSGTPCQVAGLKKFLKKDFEKLLTIDLICHGVGSPDVFKKCIEVLQDTFHGNINGYEFRAKKYCYDFDYMQKITMDGQQMYVIDDPYIQLFLSQDCLRPSCGVNCQFREMNRQGDITIGDFKGLVDVFPQLAGYKKNYSSLIFNSPKAIALIDKLNQRMNLLECNMHSIEKFNPLICKQSEYALKNNRRDAFFLEYVISPVAAIKKYAVRQVQEYKPSIRRILWNLMPFWVRNKIRR